MRGHGFLVTQMFIKAGVLGSSLRFAQIQFHHLSGEATALTCLQLKNEHRLLRLPALTIPCSPFSHC